MNLRPELLEVPVQLWLDEGDPIEQLLDHLVLVLLELLRYRGQFSISFLVYSGLDTLGVSCVLSVTGVGSRLSTRLIRLYVRTLRMS